MCCVGFYFLSPRATPFSSVAVVGAADGAAEVLRLDLGERVLVAVVGVRVGAVDRAAEVL